MRRVPALLLLAACGVNLGSPARRVFPNHPSTSSFERAPLGSTAARPPVTCAVPGGASAAVDYAAPAPWGVVMTGDTMQALVVPTDEVLAALMAQIQESLGRCPGGPARNERVVVDLVEVNAYADRYDVARVVMRMERFDDAYRQLTAWRAEGEVRLGHGAADTATLVRLAATDALAELLRGEPEALR